MHQTRPHDNSAAPAAPALDLLMRLRRLMHRCILNDLLAAAFTAAGLAGLGIATVASLFWSGWVLIALIIPLVWLGLRWRSDFMLTGIARQVEQLFPAVRDRLLPGLDLIRYSTPGREGYSTELLNAAIAQVASLLAGLPLNRVVKTRRLLFGALTLLTGTGTLTSISLLAPQRTAIGLANAFRPGSAPITLTVSPGDTSLLPGQELTLHCRVSPSGIFRHARLDLRGNPSGSRRLRLTHDTCSFLLSARAETGYRFRLLSSQSPEYRIRILKPLSLEQLEITYHYPAHTGLAATRSTVLSRRGPPQSGASEPAVSAGRPLSISAPLGTRLILNGQADQSLSQGRVIIGEETCAAAIGSEDPSCFSAEFQITADRSAAIELSPQTSAGTRAWQPVARLSIHAVADEPPFVKLFLPGRDVDLPRQMQVLLGINSIDDYGLGNLYLLWGQDTLDNRTRLRNLSGRREDTTLHIWDLSQSGMLPGDRLRYCVELSDNDAISGPKFSRSPVYSIRFPTMTEIFDAAVNQTEQTASRLGPLPAEQTAVSAEMARIADELKRNRDLSWEERRRLEQIVHEQERLTDQIAELSREVAQTAQEMLEGMTLDPATLQQLGQLQALLSRLLPPELQQALQQLRERLQQDSRQLQPALEKLQLAQEQLKQGIEQALELLERLLQEQRLEALARQAEELAAAQESLTAALHRTTPDSSSGLKQAQIAQGLDNLQQEMTELAEQFRKADSAPDSEHDIADSLAAINESLNESNTSELAHTLASQMQAGQFPPPMTRQSQNLSDQLSEAAQSLNRLSQNLKERRSRRTGEQLAQSAADILMLSEQQEQLEQALSGLPEPAQAAARQQALADGTRLAAESLAALSGRTLTAGPEIGQMLARALQSMAAAAEDLGLNRAAQARNEMRAARQHLNNAAGALLNALRNAQQQGGMMGGLESLLESLRQMAAQQLAINAGMSGIPIPIPVPGGLTEAQLQQLSRLMAQQQALREQLEQMLNSMAGQRPGLTASLDRLLEEMRAVERDLADLNITRRLIERQEDIAAHLLDAERSMRQQGFREERQSETGRPYQAIAPPQLPVDRGERNRLLREELMRALKSGYPPEYERLIRAYFERLLNAP